MIDDPAKRREQQRCVVEDQAEYLLGDATGTKECSLPEARKTISHARNASFSLNGFERNFFFEATDEGYRHLGAVSGIDSNIDARSFGTGDLDRDGDLDLVVKNLQVRLLQCFRNDIRSDAHRVFFELRGRDSNRDAVGARVEIRHGDRFQMAEVRSASGFQSQSPKELFFGLGPDAKIDRVEITWPSGRRQTFEDLAADRYYRVDERDGITGERPIARDPAALAALPGERIDGAKQTIYSHPRAAPQFKVETASGEEIRARDLYERGPVVVSFMTTWTPSYAEDLAALARLRQAVPGLQVFVFAVGLQSAPIDPAGLELAKEAGLRVARCDTRFAERFTEQPNIVFPWSFVVVDSRIVLDVITGLSADATIERMREAAAGE